MAMLVMMIIKENENLKIKKIEEWEETSEEKIKKKKRQGQKLNN